MSLVALVGGGVPVGLGLPPAAYQSNRKRTHQLLASRSFVCMGVSGFRVLVVFLSDFFVPCVIFCLFFNFTRI